VGSWSTIRGGGDFAGAKGVKAELPRWLVCNREGEGGHVWQKQMRSEMGRCLVFVVVFPACDDKPGCTNERFALSLDGLCNRGKFLLAVVVSLAHTNFMWSRSHHAFSWPVTTSFLSHVDCQKLNVW
jgi:hypothetical protein